MTGPDGKPYKWVTVGDPRPHPDHPVDPPEALTRHLGPVPDGVRYYLATLRPPREPRGPWWLVLTAPEWPVGYGVLFAFLSTN